MERATGTEVYGCGSPQSTDITLNIQTTTGGSFSVILNGKHTVEHLKKLVSKKLRVAKDRICLLHRERQLRDGTLEENGLLDGSRVILLPSVETGLLSQRPENSVMQALESLNDTQVNDFLSGKSPLNLTMRLGDNMMLIQLQLSTLNSGSTSSSRSLRTSAQQNNSKSTSSIRTKRETRDTPSPQSSPETTPQPNEASMENEKNKSDKQTHVFQFEKQDWEMLQNAFDLYRMAEEKYVDKTNNCDNKETTDTTNTLSNVTGTLMDSDQSPIKSLSNLVSSPIVASTSDNRESVITNTVKSSLIDLLSKTKCDDAVPSTSNSEKPNGTSSTSPDSSLSDDSDNFTDQSSFLTENTIDEYPMENLFNSVVDKGLFEEQEETMMDREISNLVTTNHGTEDSSTGSLPSFQSINEPLKNKRFQYLLHKTSKFKHPIRHNKQKVFMQSVVNKHKKRMQIRQDNKLAQTSTSQTEPYITNSRKLILQPISEAESSPSTSKTIKLEHSSTSQASTSGHQTKMNAVKKLVLQSNEQIDIVSPSTSKQMTVVSPDNTKKPQRTSPTPFVDTKALIEASKNLTQKLKKLSKEVLTNRIDLRAAEESMRSKIGPGAVIESMKHHGKGIYSGTFSGTLNPALQDRYGRPKRDISTIIHILNDLLCAAPPIALSQKDSKHSCSSNASDSASKCLGCSQPSCLYGQCDGHLPSTSSPDKHCSCSSNNCQCIRLESITCVTCANNTCEDKMNALDICKKCDTAKTLALENSKTKCKLEQLRLVMQQKKQRREARKLKTLPYPNTKAIATPDKTPSIPEEIETVA